jgi:uncharacterized protein (TIGR02611 family)
VRNLLARLRGNRATATVLGFTLIVVGLILSIPGVPGPGLATVFLGLVVLSDHFHWAKRTTAWVKKQFARVWPGAGKA